MLYGHSHNARIGTSQRGAAQYMLEGETISSDYFVVGEIYRWSEVNKVHRTRNGIYHSNGRLVSLLTDLGAINPCYPDFHGDSHDELYYTGSGRRGHQKLDAANQALIAATKSQHSVPLFCKLSVNVWQFLGRWSVESSEYVHDLANDRMVWKFYLRKRTGVDGN